jgi:hypothetical protein
MKVWFGFVGFRIIRGNVCYYWCNQPAISYGTHGREFVSVGAPGSSYFQTLGELLRTGRDLVNHVATILAVSLGGLLFYFMLFQTKLVPRWLSGWGFVGTTLTILATLLVMFRVIGIITTSYMVLNLPAALQEMVLALWLIVKGFNASAIELSVRYPSTSGRTG